MPGRVVAAAALSMAVSVVAATAGFAPAAAGPGPMAPAPARMCPPVTLAHLTPSAPPETGEGEQPVEQTAAPACTPFVYRMLFPLPTFAPGGWSPFGADRDGGARAHEGVDVPTPKLVPVVAVADGTVDWISRDESSRAGQAVGIRHRDGWRSVYVHLNNDTAGTDDGAGVGIRPGLEVGSPVVAGQVIGWAGNSGNAEPGDPHLHFELRTPGNVAVDPMASLRAALRRPHPSLGTGPGSFSGAYIDDDGHPFEHLFDLSVSLGLDLACDELGLEVCPDGTVTGDEAVGWVSALAGSDPALPSYQIPEPPLFVTPDVLAAAKEPHCGLLRFCGDAPITRAEAAALVAAISGPGQAPDGAYRTLHDLGLLDACLPGVDVGSEPITRSGFVVMLLRWAGYVPSPACALMS